MDEQVLQRTDPLVVRGNAFSFQMPWEKIIDELKTLLEDDNSWKTLPHDEGILAKVVLFNLRIGNVTDLSKWLPAARIRPHVVLKLMCNLVDRKYPLCTGSRVAQQIKEQIKKQLEAKFPEREAHLPENQRQGERFFIIESYPEINYLPPLLSISLGFYFSITLFGVKQI